MGAAAAFGATYGTAKGHGGTVGGNGPGPDGAGGARSTAPIQKSLRLRFKIMRERIPAIARELRDAQGSLV